MLYEKRSRSIKQHIAYFNFRSKIQLDYPVQIFSRNLVGCDSPSLINDELDNLVVSSDSREIVSPQALQTASVESVGLRYLK